MEQGIEFEAKMGGGSSAGKGVMGKLPNTGKRALTGESMFLTHFTNQAFDKKRVAFSQGIEYGIQRSGGLKSMFSAAKVLF